MDYFFSKLSKKTNQEHTNFFLQNIKRSKIPEGGGGHIKNSFATYTELTCKACMSYMTKLVGPPLDTGILDNILAIVKAVATSPSSSIRSKEPVGKKGNTNVKDATNRRGRANITDNCSNITAGELKEARNATCCPLISCALLMKRLGNPSSKLLIHDES